MKKIRNAFLIGLFCWCLLAYCRQVTANEAVLYLVITDYAGTGCLAYPVSEKETFVVEYFHSYSKFPVREIYIIGKEQTIELHQIVQKATQCSSIIYPEVRLRDDGWIEINHIHHVTSEVSFISGSPDIGDHKLEVRGRVIRLADTFPGGSEILLIISNTNPCD